jgi:hypothetical protein
VLKEHLGLLESDGPETALQRLEPRAILGLTLGLDVAGDIHPLTARDRLHEAWIEFLEELANDQPVVVLVEDLHWAEDELFDLLERLVRGVGGPLLLLGTARPELLDRRPDWGAGRRNASVLWLEPLSPAQADLMAAELLSADLPQQIRDVIGRAEGNPFFVEEVVATLIDLGVLARSDGDWIVGELPDDLIVPDSVQAVLAARIDLLGPTEKAALQAASVIGRIFWPGPVRELIGGGEPDFDVLEERDFIRHRSGSSLAGEHEYAIKHALTREVAYGSLPKARRARMHAACARWIERIAESREEQAPLLAHHYAEAVRPEDADLAWGEDQEELMRLRGKAVEWLWRAADLAVGRYEIDEGLQLLERALALEPDAELTSDLWGKIGHANALKYDGEAFWAAMQKSLELCADPQSCAEKYSELAFQTVMRAGMWRRVPEESLIRDWIQRALELSEPGSKAHVEALLAKSQQERSDEPAREASALAERLADAELRSLAWGARSEAALVTGDVQLALTWAQRRFDLLDEIRDPDIVADVYAQTSIPLVALGRFEEGRRMAQAHDGVASRLTAHHRVHGVAILLETETLAGGWEGMTPLKERTERAVEENLDTPCIRNVLSGLLLSAACAYLGDEDESRRLEEWSEAIGYEDWRLPNVPRLRLALARGDLGRVEELFHKAEEPEGETWFGLQSQTTLLDAGAILGDRARIEELAVPLLRPGSPYLEAHALRALGVVRDDGAMLEQALSRFEAMQLDWHAAETRKLLESS